MSNYYDENELIRRIQKGDESALAIIISEYHAYVGKIVYSILGSYSHKIDLQGVVNQIFFTLWHKANKIDPSKSVTIKGYLGILARNTAINEKKKCILDYQINDEVIADISDDFNQVELRLLLANALRKLNKDEQLILVLFYFQNEKIADISRISYNDMFTNISDVAYEILEENDMFNDETDDMFSSDRTCKDVTDMIHDQKIVRKRHFAIKSVLLVAALAAMSSILAIAHNYGAALIDDSNRHLVGKGLHGEGQIIGADEEIEVPDEPSDGIWETTARIKSYKNVSISPNSITEFAVSGDAGQYITPEIIFGNNDLVIFEQEDGSGWELNEGETLMIQATEYEAETNGGNGQGIMYFYICDGEILDGKSEPRKELNQTFELTAEKSGEYYICLLGISSDPISLKEGKIVIK